MLEERAVTEIIEMLEISKKEQKYVIPYGYDGLKVL